MKHLEHAALNFVLWIRQLLSDFEEGRIDLDEFLEAVSSHGTFADSNRQVSLENERELW